MRRGHTVAMQAYQQRIAELEIYEKAMDYLTERMQPWGWQHCTDEKDFADQIELVLDENKRLDAALAEIQSTVFPDSEIYRIAKKARAGE